MAFGAFDDGCVEDKGAALFDRSSHVFVECADEEVGVSVDSGVCNCEVSIFSFELSEVDLIRLWTIDRQDGF